MTYHADGRSQNGIDLPLGITPHFPDHSDPEPDDECDRRRDKPHGNHNCFGMRAPRIPGEDVDEGDGEDDACQESYAEGGQDSHCPELGSADRQQPHNGEGGPRHGKPDPP